MTALSPRPRSARGLAQATLFASLLALGACSSTQPTANPGAINTGTFPNLNIPPQSAAAQITPAEKAALLGELGAAKNAQTAAGGGPAPTANPVLLKKLAAKHGEEALEEIEGEAQ